MRIGLIARCEVARGLAIQSKNFYDNMPVERVLLVRMPRPDCREEPGWYPGAWPIQYDSIDHTLNENLVRQFLDGLDVVFTAETVYDWRLPLWAMQAGVKTVIQGNPEFFRHDQPRFAHYHHPDAWWWPTSWRTDVLPAGPVMPVPMPDDVRVTAGDPSAEGPLRLLHVAGKRAWGDRNGTAIFADSMRATTEDIHATIHGIDEELPEIRPRPGLTVRSQPSAVEDRWSMYAGQHIMVLPRRYGGLCLPALEAAAAGVAVMMPPVSPNDELASVTMASRRTGHIDLSCGRVMTAEVDHMDLGQQLDEFAQHRVGVSHLQALALRHVPRWSEWRPRYMDELQKVVDR